MKRIHVYPKLRCEVCNSLNKLNFWPLKQYELLLDVICRNCKKPAFWVHHYWNANRLIIATTKCWDKRYLMDFVDSKFGPRHGHKISTKGKTI